MTNRHSFTWNPRGICVFGSIINPKSTCVFDYWSIYHFYFTGFVYLILHHLLGISSMTHAIILAVIVTILHSIEEYLGNTSRISLEGIVADYIGPLIDSRIDPTMREIDNDYLDNSIGDILSGIISCVMIIIYWHYYGHLPYYYLLGFIIVFIMLLLKAPGMLYRK
jgi:hypothetical protein